MDVSSSMKVYRRLETPKLYANVYEETISDDGVLSRGDLVSDTSSITMTIDIEDSTGESVLGAPETMTEDTTAKYSYGAGVYSYTIPATANLGIWHYECRASVSGKVSTGRGSFEVKEQVA